MDVIRILLVEDNPLDVRLLREALRGFNGSQPSVTSVARLDDALKSLAQDSYDVVLLDLSLPDSEGFDTLVRVRAQAPALPIVVLTGYDDDHFAVRAMQEGAQDYLVKGQMDGNLILRSVRYAVERARTTTALRSSEERYRLLTESVSDVIWTVDMDLQFTYISPAIMRLSGHAPEEMLGRSVLELLAPDSAAIVERLREEMCQKLTTVQEPLQRLALEFASRHKNGTKVWTEVTISPLFDGHGRPVGFTGVTRDINERKRNEAIQSVLFKIAEAATTTQNLESFIKEIAQLLNSLIDTTNFCVVLYDREHDSYWFPYFSDENIGVHEFPHDMKGGLTDFVRRNGISMLVDEPRLYELAASGEVRIIGVPSQIWLGVPLLTAHGVIGVVVVQSYTNPQQYTKRDEELLTIVAGSIAMAIERKHSEDAVREAHRRLETLVQAMPEIVYFKDAVGRNLVVNRSFEELVQRPQAEIIGKTDDELFPESLAQKCSASDDQVKAARKPLMFEESFQNNYGYTVYFETIKVPLFDERGEIAGLVGVSRNVTERKLAEEALRTTTGQLKNLFDNLDHVFLSLELQPLRILQISPACERIFGLPRQAFFDDVRRFIDAVHPEDRAMINAVFKQIQNGETVSLVARILRPDGEIRWVECDCKPACDANGTAVRMDAVISDITQRKRAEQIQTVLMNISETAIISETLEEFMAAVRTQLGTLLDTTNFYVALYDHEKDIYSFPVFTDQHDSFGLTRRPLPKSMTDYVRRTGTPILADEAVFGDLIKSGQVELIGAPSRQWMGVPLRTSRGVIGVMAVQSYGDTVVYTMRDLYFLTLVSGSLAMVIERKRALDALIESEQQLRHAQKMEAIGRLAGGIAHDFNNLLTSILGHSELTLYKLHSDDPLRDGIEQVMKAADRAAGLTRQLLAFSRKQVLQPRVFDLNAIVADMEKMLRRLIGEDMDLVTKLAPDLGSVKADPGQIEQVVMNLAVNARDAMPNGGRLVIETANVDLDEVYVWQHGDMAPGKYIMLAVSDNGSGIDEETLTHIFEPFFTTKEHGKGTGLGLSTVYGIVKQSGGHIWVYSEIGRGTVFKIYLPRVEETPEIHKPPVGAEPLHGTETLLLVEDEEGVRELVRKILEAKGYTVISSRLPREALQLADSQQKPVDLLITDVIMPQLNGDELARQITTKYPGVKVLFISGYTGDSVGSHNGTKPGMAFLEKPFSADSLAREVRQLLDLTVPTAASS
jgi:two-component system, cell cycle sensor histidine kinase and response regulator CckA